jgi:hypothetical protein
MLLHNCPFYLKSKVTYSEFCLKVWVKKIMHSIWYYIHLDCKMNCPSWEKHPSFNAIFLLQNVYSIRRTWLHWYFKSLTETTVFPSIDASYQVSVHLAEGFQRRRLKWEKLTNDRRRTPSDCNSNKWQKCTLPHLFNKVPPIKGHPLVRPDIIYI